MRILWYPYVYEERDEQKLKTARKYNMFKMTATETNCDYWTDAMLYEYLYWQHHQRISIARDKSDLRGRRVIAVHPYGIFVVYPL